MGFMHWGSEAGAVDFHFDKSSMFHFAIPAARCYLSWKEKPGRWRHLRFRCRAAEAPPPFPLPDPFRTHFCEDPACHPLPA